MTLEPRHEERNAAAETRAAARRQARGLAGSSGIVGALIAVVFLMGVFIFLDYTLDQDPHRIVKVAMGVLVFAAIIGLPKLGLLVFPVVSPLLPWVPPSPIPGLNPLNALLFGIFGSFAVQRMLRHEPVFRSGRLGRPLGAFLALIWLSIVRGAAFPTGFTFSASVAALQAFRSATTFLVYYIVLSMARGLGDRKRIWWAVMGGLLVESLVTVLYGRNGPQGRAVGSFGQANELGAFLSMLAVVAFAGVAGIRNWFGRLISFGTFALAAFATLYSVSRGALLALVTGMAIVTWRTSRLLFLVLVAAVALSPLWIPDYVVERINNSQKDVEESDDKTLDRSASARLETWQTVFTVVEDHPLDGIGFTGLAAVLPEMGAAIGLSDVRESAHNSYLRVLAELGIGGFAVFVWLVVSCIRLGDLVARRGRHAFDRAMGVGLIGATAALLVSCAFGDRFFNVVMSSSLWVLCAIVEDAIPDRRKPA